MNSRTVILIIVAFVIAGFASFLMRGQVASDGPDASKTKVLVAISNIAAGSFVRVDKDIAWADWPRDNVTPSMITQDSEKVDQYNGAVARRSIATGETIARNTLVRSTEGGFLSAVLAPGSRAVSISVNATSGNAGFVFPGDHVDLILTHRITMTSNGDINPTSKTVLASETFAENVRVVAVDQMLDNPENKAVLAKTLTLEVSPKQAEKINVAVNLGTISVSLRSLGNGPDTIVGRSAAPATAGIGSPDMGGETMTQDSDVSKLIDTKGDGHTRVKVIRGGTSEQVDFLRDSP